MRIVDIREHTAKLGSGMRNAAIDFSRMTTSVVAIVTDVIRDGKPVVGYGYASNGRYAQGGILRERLLPRIREANPEDLLDSDGNLDPFRVQACMMRNEKPGGHGDRAVAAAVVDMAVWDVVGKIAEKPLWQILSERYSGGRHDDKVMVYPGGGYYYPGKEIEQLQTEMRNYREQGYRIVKMKVAGASIADDVRRIEAVLEIVGTGDNLAVDANGRYDLETALAFGKAVAPYKLSWFEEPGDPLDFALNAELCKHYDPPIATAENLFSAQDVKNLALYGGMRTDCDWIQMDPALGYGLSEYLKMLAETETLGWTRDRHVPHGGHLLGLHMAAGLQLGGTESYPLVFQPFGGFTDGAVIEDGFTAPPMAPGLGVERKAALYEVLRPIGEG